MVCFSYPFLAPDTYCTQEEKAWRNIKENKNLMTLLPSPSPLYCHCVLLFCRLTKQTSQLVLSGHRNIECDRNVEADNQLEQDAILDRDQ